MRIKCPNCPAAYELDDGRIPPAALSLKCPKSRNPFTAQGGQAAEKAAGKVPLPGPAAPPAGKPPGARAKSPNGAVPLPGTSQFPTPAPTFAMGASAVPLPGSIAVATPAP